MPRAMVLILVLVGACSKDASKTLSPDVGVSQDVDVADASSAADVSGPRDGSVMRDDGQVPDGNADLPSADADPTSDTDMPTADAMPRCPEVAHASGGAALSRSLPAFAGRPYHVHVPPGYDCELPLPVLVVIHGGGSNGEDMPRVTCPTGDPAEAGCMNAYADQEGFIVVYPNGTSNPLLPNVRTFNAGGGSDGYVCVSGYACNQDVDDLPYFDALLDDLESAVAVDTNRIYATGISNGAAMSHRLACERADRIAAIAPVAGANQLETTGICAPSRPVPAFQIHGVADPSWPYDGGPSDGMPNAGSFAAVADTIAGWEARHGCTGSIAVTDLPDIANDNTTTRRIERDDCPNVALFEVVGGGHTWPGGFQYLSETRIGRTSRDVSANELIWESVRGVSL